MQQATVQQPAAAQQRPTAQQQAAVQQRAAAQQPAAAHQPTAVQQPAAAQQPAAIHQLAVADVQRAGESLLILLNSSQVKIKYEFSKPFPCDCWYVKQNMIIHNILTRPFSEKF